MGREEGGRGGCGGGRERAGGGWEGKGGRWMGGRGGGHLTVGSTCNCAAVTLYQIFECSTVALYRKCLEAVFALNYLMLFNL
jgi:hypothetical protein